MSIRELPPPPPGVLIADCAVEPHGYHIRRPHGARNWLITYTTGGAGRYGHAAGAHRCRAGDVVLLAPGAPHDYATAAPGEPWRFFWAHFAPRPAWAGWLQLPVVAPGLLALGIAAPHARARISGAFERLLADARGTGPLHEDLAMNALEEVLLVAGGALTPSAATRDPRVEAVLGHLAAHLDRPVSVAEAARTVALSPSRLAHLFRAEVGDSIQRVHMQLRLRHAARLLAHTGDSVGAIAEAVGFRSPFHFSQQFKANYSLSPAAYRRELARR